MFGVFKKQVNVVKAGWLTGFSEIHCHLLPNVDDGSSSYEETIKLLAQYSNLGVERIALSPHIMQRYAKNTSQTLRLAFEDLEVHLRADFSDIKFPELSLGAEYMLDENFRERLAEPLLTIGTSDYLLVEASFYGAPLGLYDLIFAVAARGVRPMLAHPERYLYLSMEDYQKLKAHGCALQLNLFSLSGMYSPQVNKRASELLKAGMYDFIGLDTHRSAAFSSVLESANIAIKYEQPIRKLIEKNNLLFD